MGRYNMDDPDDYGSLSMKFRRAHALEVARDLRYKHDIIKRIREAKTIGEIDRALADGRHNI